MKLTFKLMSEADARDYISWQYDDQYSIYNLTVDNIDKEVAFTLDPANHYYGIYDGDELVGHAVFHQEARVKGGNYSLDALDVGAGMRPDWTGQGKGAEIIGQIIDFGREQYGASVFRATIADWNIRSQKATMKNGFKEVSRFTAPSGTGFIIFVRQD